MSGRQRYRSAHFLRWRDFIRLKNRRRFTQLFFGDRAGYEDGIGERPAAGARIDFRDARVDTVYIGAARQGCEDVTKSGDSRVLRQVAAYRPNIVVAVKEALDIHKLVL